MGNIPVPQFEKMLIAGEITQKQYEAFIQLCSNCDDSGFVPYGMVHHKTFAALCDRGLFEEKINPSTTGYVLSSLGEDIWKDFQNSLTTE